MITGLIVSGSFLIIVVMLISNCNRSGFDRSDCGGGESPTPSPTPAAGSDGTHLGKLTDIKAKYEQRIKDEKAWRQFVIGEFKSGSCAGWDKYFSDAGAIFDRYTQINGDFAPCIGNDLLYRQGYAPFGVDMELNTEKEVVPVEKIEALRTVSADLSANNHLETEPACNDRCWSAR